MVFSSIFFIFIFLPLFLLVYYLTPMKHRSLIILLSSYAFYAWWRVDFLALFILVTAWNYLISIQIAKQALASKKWLIFGIVGNLSTLGYFKYANFGIEALNQLLISVDSSPIYLAQVILPIGISFYIFQAISYLVDVYRKDAEIANNFIDFAAFIALFPQLIAGPVIRYKDVEQQFRHREHSFDLFAQGASRFMQGFIKKVFIADTLAPIVTLLFASENPSLLDSWLGLIAYAAQLYFDFSGYTDMAIGLGLMLGFKFPENFNHPYSSQSITEFWKRWHMSLSSWLRDYLYIPLGGSRHGKLKNYRNLFLTMLIGGFWHGASWNFVIWGAWHGALLAFEKFTGLSDYQGFNPLRWLYCLFVVLLGWVFFRATDVASALLVIQGLFNWQQIELSNAIDLELNSFVQFILLTAVLLIFFNLGKERLVDYFQREQAFSSRHSYSLTQLLRIGQVSAQLITFPLFALCVAKLIVSNQSPFLYFQF